MGPIIPGGAEKLRLGEAQPQRDRAGGFNRGLAGTSAVGSGFPLLPVHFCILDSLEAKFTAHVLSSSSLSGRQWLLSREVYVESKKEREPEGSRRGETPTHGPTAGCLLLGCSMLPPLPSHYFPWSFHQRLFRTQVDK